MGLRKLIGDFQRRRVYRSILNQFKKDIEYVDSNGLRLYVLVRSDILPPLNQGIQAAHAVVEFGIQHSLPTFTEWAHQHKTLILLGVNHSDYWKMKQRLFQAGKCYSAFYEPDLIMETAIAVEPMTREEAEQLFSHLALAS